jgi:HSP20 family protein
MAESETKNAQRQSSEQQTTQQTASRSGAMQSSGQGGQGRTMARRGGSSPTLFMLNPIDLFTVGPFELMRRFSEQMDQAFGDYGLSNTSGRQGGDQMATWTPAVEVIQRDDNLIVRAELPGLSPQDVRVEVTDDGLIIEGERREEREENDQGVYRREINYGRFYRMVPLPDGVDADQVRAQFNNGVLEVIVPVPQAQQRRREIPVGTAGGEQARTASAQPAQG